jgi:hypothetical protein
MEAQKGDERIVDHINRDKLDNRKSNLRFVDASESSSNTARRGRSGLRGVYRHKTGRWYAKAQVRGKMHYLGTYETSEEAYEVVHQWRLLNMPGYTGS